MAINHRFRTVFVHVPKTAGSSMELKPFVGLEGRQTHWSIVMFLRQMNEQQKKNYFKWCFVRNPYDRLVSSYHWGMKQHKQQYLKDINSFENFVMNKIEKFYNFNLNKGVHQTRSGIHVIPQHVFINGSLGFMNFVGKFENLQEDFLKLCEKIEEHSGVKIPNKELPLKKKTNHKHYKDYFTPEMYKKVNKLYEKDFELFNYKKIVPCKSKENSTQYQTIKVSH